MEPATEKKSRRKRRELLQQTKEISKLQRTADSIGKLLRFTILAAILIAATYYGYKGLLWLSDWMNEIEERRERSRYPLL